MKITHVIPRDVGGGGRAAYRLHAGLRQLGEDSTLFMKGSAHHDAAVVQFAPAADPLARARRFARRLRQHFALRPYLARLAGDDRWGVDGTCPFGGEALAQMPQADVVNLHGLQGFIDCEDFFCGVPLRAPVVYTLHTMAPFTGGCTTAGGCRRFEQQCGRCPYLGSQREDDLSRRNWVSKERAYREARRGRVHLVAPSRWLAGEVARSSLLARLPISIIPLAVDTAAYAPRDRRHAREVLGLDPAARVVLFLSQYPEANRRKGLPELLTALGAIRERVPGLQLITLGTGALPADLPVPNMPLGFVGNERLQSLIYSAADLLAFPSRGDNLPLAVIEALACGTPVLATNLGGIPELVRPGITGELVPLDDAGALAAALRDLLLAPERLAELSQNCRRVAVAEYSLEIQARRYVDLYRSLIAERPS